MNKFKPSIPEGSLVERLNCGRDGFWSAITQVPKKTARLTVFKDGEATMVGTQVKVRDSSWGPDGDQLAILFGNNKDNPIGSDIDS